MSSLGRLEMFTKLKMLTKLEMLTQLKMLIKLKIKRRPSNDPLIQKDDPLRRSEICPSRLGVGDAATFKK